VDDVDPGAAAPRGMASGGAGLGLAPAAPIAPRSLDWGELGVRVVLAPIAEELVYRATLQRALQRSVGSLLAIPLASVVFAASHLAPWPMLASLLLGLVAGVLTRASGGIGLGTGLHAGLDLAGSRLGAPAFGGGMDPAVGVPLGALALAAGIALQRATALPAGGRRR